MGETAREGTFSRGYYIQKPNVESSEGRDRHYGCDHEFVLAMPNPSIIDHQRRQQSLSQRVMQRTLPRALRTTTDIPGTALGMNGLETSHRLQYRYKPARLSPMELENLLTYKFFLENFMVCYMKSLPWVSPYMRVPALYRLAAAVAGYFDGGAANNARLERRDASRPEVNSFITENRRLVIFNMTMEDNGNVTELLKPTSSSNEDLSEYTDADESISAPTEFLAEFLSAVMMKDYVTALKYCKLILQYEPNNATAKEFYPLILEKLQHVTDGSSNDNESEDEEISEGSSSSNTDSENSSSGESSEGQEDEEVEVEQGSGDKQSKGSSEGDGTTGSYSSLEDDEAESVDQLVALAARFQIDNMNLGNGNKIYNTDHPTSASVQNKVVLNKKDLVNPFSTQSNQIPFGTSSDSESPTEPVTQQTIAMLRAKVVANKI
ncbi:hypothetical protein JTB14_020761 [Gonioctena quinquepunctata]|nr:hypothetical protein JTB14_020761 [Gonioctena quinquepunctata]